MSKYQQPNKKEAGYGKPGEEKSEKTDKRVLAGRNKETEAQRADGSGIQPEIRHKNPQLRRGDFERLVEDDALHGVVFSRSLGERKAYLVINASEKEIDLQAVASKWFLPTEKPLWDAINQREVVFGKNSMTIKVPCLEGLILIDQGVQVSP